MFLLLVSDFNALMVLVAQQEGLVKNWVVGCWHCYLFAQWGADFHIFKLMPLPLTVSCYS